MKINHIQVAHAYRLLKADEVIGLEYLEDAWEVKKDIHMAHEILREAGLKADEAWRLKVFNRERNKPAEKAQPFYKRKGLILAIRRGEVVQYLKPTWWGYEEEDDDDPFFI